MLVILSPKAGWDVVKKKKKKKIRVFENFKIPLLAYALMDLAGIWTIPLVFYAGHFKPQGRVRCG